MNPNLRILGLVLVLAVGFQAGEVSAQQSIPDRLYQLEQSLNVTNGNINYLWLADRNDVLMAFIGESDANQGVANFHNNQGKRVVFIGATDDAGQGIVNFYNRAGLRILFAGTTNQGDGGARIWNQFGTEVTYIGSFGGGDSGVWGGSTFYSSTGNAAAYIGATSWGDGTVEINGSAVHDYAEVFELATRKGVSPGTVMSVLDEGVELAPSGSAYDPKVVGVVSGAGGYRSGMRIGTREDGSTDLPIAMSGQVYVRACLENGPIQVGDLLVASSRSGLAMRASDKVRAIGAVVGKALEPYHGEPGESEGLIRMLVMTR